MTKLPGLLSSLVLLFSTGTAHAQDINACIYPLGVGVTPDLPTGVPGFCDSIFDAQAIDTQVCDFGFFPNLVRRGDWFSFTAPITGDYYFLWNSDPNAPGYPYLGVPQRMAIYDQPQFNAPPATPDDPALVIACSEGHDSAQVQNLPLVRNQTILLHLGGVFAGHGFADLNPGIMEIGIHETYVSSCNGDGGDQQSCTDCPCSNNATPGTIGGCLNSSGNSTRLFAGGSASVGLPANSDFDLFFAVTGAPGGSLCGLWSGAAIAPNNGANPCFGLGSGVQSQLLDGLRCAVASTRRHGFRVATAAGNAGQWGGDEGPAVGIAQAGIGFVAGQSRYFQMIGRDDSQLSCMRGLETSQAIRVTFRP